MNKDIKDYLHLYLGCEILFDNKLWILSKVGGRVIKLTRTGKFNKYVGARPVDVKLILRPLSDMTEEEYIEWHTIVVGDARDATRYFIETDGEKTRYLLSKQFDLFNLIPEGLAIDKTTLKQTT